MSILPFILSWYQITNSQEAIINQSQKSHMIISRATADRISSHLEKYIGLSDTLGNNPRVYLRPDSAESSELLKATMISEKAILAIGLTIEQEGAKPSVIQLLKKNNALKKLEEIITNPTNKQITLRREGKQNYLIIKKQTARPKVDISIVLPINFSKFLNPTILGQFASISLVSNDGSLIENSGEVFVELSKTLTKQIQSGMVFDSANRYTESNEKDIVALASVAHAQWSVISRQPLKFAEVAASNMASTARKTFMFILIIMGLLILLAYYSWVKPLRKIVKSYRSLLGADGEISNWKGNEVAALEQSFDTITKHIDNRNALSQIFVDRYQVISAIGAGGMGSVFLGWDPRLKRHVALKTLPINSTFASREDMSEVLVQEAITAAKISHRNVVSIYDVVSTDSTAFIAMEYVDGETLHTFIKRNKRLSLEQTIVIAIAISKGLHSAHEMGFVHRDIKPENILLGVNGDIKIIDFGTTSMLQTLVNDDVTGTNGYIAPEIYKRGEVSVKSDLFALGVVIATCILGENPFLGKKVHITKNNIINKKIVFPADIKTIESSKLLLIIERLLSKNPDKRPESAAMVAKLVSNAASHKPQWNAKIAGVQSSREHIYADSKNTTVIPINNS
ncbi:MAG: serine/threonine protein kinase [Alcanivoracaceae bacterium]|nr:serine/threonine protein kinase [Alcanivoracaceae bacterium]